jgi:ectoine hydroxylase-related dioxygenase (phytanoyl-CoA dioxygenase family)
MQATRSTKVSVQLSAAQREIYQREGFLIVDQPVLPEPAFVALKQHFEDALADLAADVRPETMDVPHFTDPALFTWLFADEVLDLVEQIIGPDIALWSSHFICKPKGDGKRVPWHEDSAYWKGQLEPMDVVTLWLAIDPSTTENGCMYVVPRTHDNGFSEYEDVDTTKNVFSTEIKPSQRRDALAVPCELQPNQASLHDGRLIHGSPPNTSELRRCGYTMRYIPTTVRFRDDVVNHQGATHQIYLARGRDHAGNHYADPARAYPELARYRKASGRKFH